MENERTVTIPVTEESLPVCQVCDKQIRDEYCYQYDPDDIETCMCEDCVNKAVHTIKPGLLQDIVSDFLSDLHTATPLKEGRLIWPHRNNSTLNAL